MHTPRLHLSSPARSSVRRFDLLLWLLFALPVALFAQATGTITGQVFKPGTGEFVRSAEVRISGTNQVTDTDREGSYVFTGVPAGDVTVEVSFTGYETAKTTVTVVAGQTVTRDVSLYTAEQRTMGDAGEVIELEAFIISAEVEGQAKATQNQRRSMTIGDHVSSDEFGDVVEGNIGEFLKHLPGVDLEYVQFDARGPRMRGLDPQYVGVTMDGVKLASADAFNATVGTDNAGADGSRAFGFESISLSSVDSVEVYKNLSADLDADAPAGTINLRSKRAFDRSGRRISYTASLSANSEEFQFERTSGPGDYKHHKALPSVSLEYSDIFLNKRLGIILTYNRSSLYNEFQQYSMTTVNRTATVADPRVAVPQTITFTDGPKLTDRETFGFRVDYKLSPRLSFGVNTTFAKYHATWDNRQFRFVTSTNNNATSRATVVGSDPMVSFTSSAANSSLTLTGDGADKFTDTTSIMPSFDWKPTNTLTVEGRFGWSKSDNEYRAISEGKARSTVVDALSGIQYTANRTSIGSADWTFNQVAGADWGVVTNYKNPRITDEGRNDSNEVYSGGLDITWKRPIMGLPTFFKAGIKSREDYRKFADRRSWYTWRYDGPGGGATGNFPANTLTGDSIDMSALDIDFNSLSNLPPAFPGRSYAADLYRSNPELFTQTGATPANHYAAFIGNNRNVYERVDAAYVLANTRINRLQIQAGVRFEKTTDVIQQPTQRTRAEMVAGGYTLDATGRATTIPGLQYQFRSLPDLEKETSYDHVFLSSALKYTITDNLIAQVGMHQAINRPPLTVIAGVTTFNEQSLIISAPNPGLLPEESNNYSAKLAYYLPKSGTLSAGVFQIDIDNLRVDFDRPPGTWFDEFPEIDPVTYGAYTVRSTVNSENSRRFRGVELEYRQGLYFLPKPFLGSNVYANYTRAYADVRRGGMAPHQINAGATFRYKRLSLGGNAIWTSDTPWTNTANSVRFRDERIRTDVNASFVINKWATLVLAGRDVGNVGQSLIEKRAGRSDELVQKDLYGALWTFSVKGSF
ncbi:hypothetical protein CMV30_16550 [Nibricoccus aquaticus]|uniref:TonB-dependent receptor n=1 Tax=Nibricoccus aquaticus TaxID=2576891 RepID=A0A290QA80_9BACT|nr:TonB-dependent receptor [Nibricoccus aquaticus]ATC65424.1 hypothetical protein CMV30_16550 [Nibricoccus aquaticus]